MDHKAEGNRYVYFPLVTQDQYSKRHLRKLIGQYFSNSYKNLVSFFSREEDLSTQDMEEIIKILQNQINEQKKSGDEPL
ncbi:MAG: BlaI/MecI/CopY family transcriptional regulator [Bacteroidia bacterium]|nr:BlaI/MecI/CopY family transcriptional regulator [Bacteroidia bacterium]